MAVISKAELLANLDCLPKDTALISISEPPYSEYLHEGLTDKVLNLFQASIASEFWDIEEAIDNYEPISMQTAKALQEFILTNSHLRFIVHCRAGQSRSAGVAKAIECLLAFGPGPEAKYLYSTGFTSAISSNPRYSPNLTVFDKIVLA